MTHHHTPLPDLVLTTRANQQCAQTGIDSPDRCLDSEHFAHYPHFVHYQFNSRGFRDSEWPNDLEQLQQSIWCIGDSFTVGVGQPYHHIWPQILSAKTGSRTINVAMDGASNAWIARRAQQIQREISPAKMVVMWSYWHRRESPDLDKPDEERRLLHADTLDHTKDMDEFEQCRQAIKSGTSQVIECVIPNYSGVLVDLQKIWNDIRRPSWPIQHPADDLAFNALPDWILQEIDQAHGCTHYFRAVYRANYLVQDIICVPRLDIARDGHHFDVLTSEWLVERLRTRWPG